MLSIISLEYADYISYGILEEIFKNSLSKIGVLYSAMSML